MKTTEDKIEDALQEAANELENANYHTQVDLPRDIYEAIEGYILFPNAKLDVAKKIAKVFINGI